jgi:hypothetical protein
MARPSCCAPIIFEGLRSRKGQTEAILVTYDVLEVDGEDMRPEPLEERASAPVINRGKVRYCTIQTALLSGLALGELRRTSDVLIECRKRHPRSNI